MRFVNVGCDKSTIGHYAQVETVIISVSLTFEFFAVITKSAMLSKLTSMVFTAARPDDYWLKSNAQYLTRWQLTDRNCE